MSGLVKGKTFEIDHIRVTIGRSEKNMIALDDSSVSSQHCVVVRDGDRYFIEDLGSTNGTRLNFKSIQKAPLRSKDILRIGGIEFMFDADFFEDEDEDASSISTKIEVIPGPAEAPKNFTSISPVARSGSAPASGKGKSLWIVLISIVALLAIGAVIVLVLSLGKES